jgi:hypothetical protein
MLREGEVLIHDKNYKQFLPGKAGAKVDSEKKKTGLIPRDYDKHPLGCYGSAPPFTAVDVPLIPESEWSQRCKDKIAEKSQLSDIRNVGDNGQPITALDQNGKGYCWAHSTTSAVTLLRAVMNEPYVPLSAYAIACIVKNYRDEGGWGALSLDFATTRGIPSQQFWPQQSMDKGNDKPETWANAAKHKTTEGWVDLQSQAYDRTLSRAQVGSLLLSDCPVVVDYNWWSHSVCAMDLVDGATTREQLRADSGKLLSLEEFDRIWKMDDAEGGFGVRILNSWGKWSDNGAGVLAPGKAWPDGAVAPRATLPSPA